MEQSKSSAWCQNGPCCPPPRTPKIHRFPPSKSEAATPSPGCFSPRQRGRQLIVMLLGGGIKRNSQNRPPIAIRPGYQTPPPAEFRPEYAPQYTVPPLPRPSESDHTRVPRRLSWCCGGLAMAVLRYCTHSLCRRHGRMVLSDMVCGCVRGCVEKCCGNFCFMWRT